MGAKEAAHEAIVAGLNKGFDAVFGGPVPAGTLSPAEQQSAPPLHAVIIVSVGRAHNTIEVECYGEHRREYPQTSSSPGERGGFHVERVIHGDADITDLFSDDQIAALGAQCGASGD